MTEHVICRGCRWNNYPTCSGTIMQDGGEMNIENLRPGFTCGQKFSEEVQDFSIELKDDYQKKLEELEQRIIELESKIEESTLSKL